MSEINERQHQLVHGYLPVQRGNVRISNLTMIHAVLYVAENGCKWRALPPRFGKRHTIYTRLRRLAAAGVLDRLFEALQQRRLIRIEVEWLGLDNTSIKVHPDGTGTPKKGASSHRKIPRRMEKPLTGLPTLMNRTYEGDETRQLVLKLGFSPVAPPKLNRRQPWDYDRNLYKRRNEIERLFRRLKGYRRIFTRFEKLDLMFNAFLNFVPIIDLIKC